MRSLDPNIGLRAMGKGVPWASTEQPDALGLGLEASISIEGGVLARLRLNFTIETQS